MIRFSTNILQQMGPKLVRDAWWRATLAGLVAYIVLQATTLAALIAIYVGRARGECLVGPECGLLAGVGDGAAGAIALFGGTLSVVILLALWRLMRALWVRSFWTAIILRGVGWTTAVIGLLFILGEGLPWLVVGASLAITSRRMQAGIEWDNAAMAGAMGGAMGGAGQQARRSDDVVHSIKIEDDPIDPDDIVDVQFEDK